MLCMRRLWICVGLVQLLLNLWITNDLYFYIILIFISIFGSYSKCSNFSLLFMFKLNNFSLIFVRLWIDLIILLKHSNDMPIYDGMISILIFLFYFIYSKWLFAHFNWSRELLSLHLVIFTDYVFFTFH